MISRKISKNRAISLTATFAALYGTLTRPDTSKWIEHTANDSNMLK